MKKNCIKTLKTLVSKGICTHGGGGCMTKQSILSICSLAVLLSLSTPAQADEIYTPTLDKLHQSGTTMPDTSEIYPESAYTLTESAQNAENTITLYEKTEIIRYYDPLTGQEVAKSDLQPDIEYKEVKTIQTTPKYYQVALKQTEYGSGDGEKYFKWENTENGLILTETDKANAQITAKYDTTQFHTRLENTSDNSSMNITGGSFVNQTVGNTSGVKVGGAIYNSGSSAKLGDISADFIGNSAISTGGYSAYGGAIYNYYDSTIGDITGDFIGNYVSGPTADGGAISNNWYGTIGNITGDFIGNYTDSTEFSLGGAISNMQGSTIGNITGDFIGNYATATSSIALGGAILNLAATIGDISGSFINNTAESATGTAIGGAIFSTNALTISANDAQTVFSGNITISNGSTEQNAIAMYSLYLTDEAAANFGLPSGGFVANETFELSPQNPAILTLKAENNGSIIFNDTIKGGAIDYYQIEISGGKITPDSIIETPETAFTLNITGDKTGQIYLNNAIINANISIDNTNVYVNTAQNLAQSPTLAVNSGSLTINSLPNQSINFQKFSNTAQINIASVDVNLQNATMGQITANQYGNMSGKFTVQSLNLLNDSPQNKTTIPFAPPEYAQNVTYSGPSPIAYSPLYKYNVSYNPEDGFFTFMRGASSSSNPSDNYNPAALTSPVTTQAGAYSTQLQTFNYAFQHSDNFMNLPYLERLTLKSQNKYALSPTGDATDVGTLSPLFTKEENAGLWLKPYASFESIPLNNGPKVSNINYGTLIGHDSELTPIKHGFDRVLTSYIGYNGASQRFNGVDAYQNGALIGQTITLYKNNFFNATTTSIGASTGSSTNMYGSEHYSMLLAGIANKAGYNLEFKNGKIILQPSLLISYTFVNTFDYNNSAGLRIKSDPLHAIQLAPGIKLIANTNSGWQPYLAISMIWNILDKTNVKANDTRLPEMSIDPYLQYGLGLQKPLKNNYLAYAQAMIHSGGRNGISLSAGLRWKIGKNK